jgi:hypothetical protein
MNCPMMGDMQKNMGAMMNDMSAMMSSPTSMMGGGMMQCGPNSGAAPSASLPPLQQTITRLIIRSSDILL